MNEIKCLLKLKFAERIKNWKNMRSPVKRRFSEFRKVAPQSLIFLLENILGTRLSSISILDKKKKKMVVSVWWEKKERGGERAFNLNMHLIFLNVDLKS